MEAAALRGNRSKQGGFFGKFGFALTEQPNDSPGKPVSVFVGFPAVDFAANKRVFNGVALVHLNFHHGNRRASLVKGERENFAV